ncbi:hypothetical protein LX36DRAFT_490501 [Colletotrichum falcatum]|nr:hypothetical protein LX36DRAFT_490501 [Colletotrichum falcatum]
MHTASFVPIMSSTSGINFPVPNQNESHELVERRFGATNSAGDENTSGNSCTAGPPGLSIKPKLKEDISTTGSNTSINTTRSVVHESEPTLFDESQPLNEPETTAEQDETSAANQITKSPQVDESKWQTWWLETISSLLALASVVAIIIILSLHQGKPLPSWPALISVNSLVPIFTAIFKASIVMPVAEATILGIS